MNQRTRHIASAPAVTPLDKPAEHKQLTFQPTADLVASGADRRGASLLAWYLIIETLQGMGRFYDVQLQSLVLTGVRASDQKRVVIHRINNQQFKMWQMSSGQLTMQQKETGRVFVNLPTYGSHLFTDFQWHIVLDASDDEIDRCQLLAVWNVPSGPVAPVGACCVKTPTTYWSFAPFLSAEFPTDREEVRIPLDQLMQAPAGEASCGVGSLMVYGNKQFVTHLQSGALGLLDSKQTDGASAANSNDLREAKMTDVWYDFNDTYVLATIDKCSRSMQLLGTPLLTMSFGNWILQDPSRSGFAHCSPDEARRLALDLRKCADTAPPAPAPAAAAPAANSTNATNAAPTRCTFYVTAMVVKDAAQLTPVV